MWKSMNTVLMLVILCGGLQLSHGEKLKCQFADNYYDPVGYLYSCYVTSLDNSFDNMTIDGYIGVHKNSKNDNDVKGIWIQNANLKYIPKGLGSLFNLLGLAIWTSQLVEIRSNDFLGMQNLEYLALSGNKLKSVPSDAFSTLTKLKVIRLYKNQIEELSSELFSNNLNLEEIDFDNNKIKFICSEVFNNLRNLNIVEFGGNICLNEDYSGIERIIQMKTDIITNCKNPATTTTTTTTTTQNPMEVELEALKNELAAATKELQKEQLENLKVKIERDALQKEKNILMINYDVLTQDKEALKMIIDTLLKEKDVWIKENNELKLELNNKTTEINELNDKLQTNCNPIEAVEALDMKMNVINAMMEQLLKASKEHQIECQERIKLRAELETAKNQQKIEENEKDQLKKQLIKDKEAMEEEKNLMKTKYELELSNKITEINEINEKNENCNKRRQMNNCFILINITVRMLVVV